MKNRFVSAAVTAALLSVACVPAVQAQSADLQALKAQLEALQKKVSDLETQQKKQEEVADKTLDQVAQQRANVGDWVGRFTWKGDLRYRNEDIRQELVPGDRDRDRIRARLGVVAKVNDTVTAELQFTTGESLSSGGYGDARSPNQTLTDANSRKRVWFDTAFFQWKPNANWTATLGKQRYPWIRPANVLFFDGDINPEGVSIGWQQGADGLFATAWYVQLAERNAGALGGADSTMTGGQFGWRGPVGPARLTVAAGYYDHGAVKGYNAVQDGALGPNPTPNNSYGNTTATGAACKMGLAACIADDFNIYEGVAELTFTVAGKPLTFVGDYAKNNKADFGTTFKGLDTAFAVGAQYGRVSTLNTWEIGYLYQKVENDALYGQWVDSDFGGGTTGTKGHVFRFGYGLGRNFRFNTTYFINDQNIDIPATVGTTSLTDRKYKRLQLDVVASF
jgi:hypothetical protein